MEDHFPSAQLQGLKPVFDIALDAVVAMRADGTVAEWNRVAEKVFGWKRKEALGQLMADLIVPPQHRDAHIAGLARFIETGIASVLDRTLEITAIDRHQLEFPVELSITAIGSADDRLFIGFLRDISKRKKSEELLRRQAREADLLFQVSQSAALNERLEPVLKDALLAICEITGWPIGHALLPPAGQIDQLVSTGIWHGAEHSEAKELRQATEEIVFTPGMGLPGEVLRRGEPVWVTDTENTAFFVRKGLGFGAAFAFPLKSAGGIMAVLEFFTHDRTPPDRDLLLAVRALGEQVGRALERSNAVRQLQALNQSLEQRIADALSEQRKADALYRAYFENSPEALFVIGVGFDGAFYAEQVNPAHEASVGFKAEDIRGKRIDELLPAELAEPILASYRKVVETGQTFRYREVFSLNGEQQHWDTTLVPVRDSDGNITHLFGSSRNVTAQVAAEEALRQAQKMEAVGQLTGGIAHDFNNLLGAVLGAFDLIRRKADDPERVKRLAESGVAAAERGSRLTSQLLAFSRSQQIELRPLVLAEVVSGMHDLLSSTLGPMVRLRLDLDEEGARVLSDPVQLEMAVLNLAINSRDAMPSGGELTIKTRPVRIEEDAELPPGEYVALSVSDTGCGMLPEVAGRAFDPFFTTKGVGKGSGLGLSQAYGIAWQTGGTARIESLVGHGTTIQLLLPRTSAEVSAPQTPSDIAVSTSMSTATVLVIDDDEDVRSMLMASVEALGYKVLEAADGGGGLAVAEECAPDLVLVDFAMPGINGAEVAEALWVRQPELPIVFVTGYAETEAIERAAGPQARMLRKPFRIEELQAMLAEALNGKL
jgi:PAS domain S-box-containing protein